MRGSTACSRFTWRRGVGRRPGPARRPPPWVGGGGEPKPGPTGAPSAVKTASSWSDEQIVKALADNAGNVRGTARALGMHRNQLRRWLEKHPEVAADRSEGSSPPEDS